LKFVVRLIGLLSIACAAAAAPAVAADVPSAPYVWRNVVVGAGGFAPNVIFSPAENGLAYLRTDMGGAYRWDPRQQSWIPIQDGLAESSYFGIESLAADPKHPNVVYLAAGMYSGGPSAILRSSDRGRTWSITPVPFKMGGNEDGRGLGERLAIDPNRTSTLLFGSRHDGLWRSDDSGKNWRKVVSFPWKGLGLPTDWHSHGGVSFVVFDPNSRNVFAGVADPTQQHLFRSNDGGATWAALPGGPPANLLPVKGAIDASGILYVDYASGIGPNGIASGAVWKLDTPTGKWTDITPSPRTEGGYMGLSVDRSTPGRLAVSSVDRWRPGDTIWVSTDSGRNWTDLKPRSRRDIVTSPWLNYGQPEAEFGHWTAGLAIDPFRPGSMAYTTGATIYRTDEALKADTITWRAWVRGVEQTVPITLISPTGGAHLISGIGDIGGFVHDRLDAAAPRIHLNPHLNNTNNLDYAGLAPNVVVRSGSLHIPDPAGAYLAWSEDGGHSWSPLLAPPMKIGDQMTARFDFGDAPIDVGADGKTFIIGTPVDIATNDRGKTWFVPDGLPAGIRVIADKADPKLWYAVDYAAGKVFVSRDGARSFLPAPAKGLPTNLSSAVPRSRESPSALLVTPGKAGDLWFLVARRLYRSTDAARSFAAASGADIKIQLFGLGKAAPGASAPSLYAFGEKGGVKAVWRSTDAGATWLRINDDQHQWGLRFRMLSGDPRIFGRVYLATDGRGIVYGEPAALGHLR
jgi:photosystem II stability/assembly factor-like uncharacterized protein